MIGAVSCDGEKPLRPLDEADELDDGDGGNETGTESNEMDKQLQAIATKKRFVTTSLSFFLRGGSNRYYKNNLWQHLLFFVGAALY